MYPLYLVGEDTYYQCIMGDIHSEISDGFLQMTRLRGLSLKTEASLLPTDKNQKD
jgi:hypothetical protein